MTRPPLSRGTQIRRVFFEQVIDANMFFKKENRLRDVTPPPRMAIQAARVGFGVFLCKYFFKGRLGKNFRKILPNQSSSWYSCVPAVNITSKLPETVTSAARLSGRR